MKHFRDASLTHIDDPLSVKMAKVDGERGEDWLNDENENALIDMMMWQAKPILYDVTCKGYSNIMPTNVRLYLHSSHSLGLGVAASPPSPTNQRFYGMGPTYPEKYPQA